MYSEVPSSSLGQETGNSEAFLWLPILLLIMFPYNIIYISFVMTTSTADAAVELKLVMNLACGQHLNKMMYICQKSQYT
jgi:hypothetical protein